MYEYQDTEDQVTVKTAQQHKWLEAAQDKEEDELMAIMGKDAHLLLQDQCVWNAVQAAKGDGKGTPDNKGKGKGRGKGGRQNGWKAKGGRPGR